jgi:hypothetical protein
VSALAVAAADFPADLMAVLQDDSFVQELAGRELVGIRTATPPLAAASCNPVVSMQYKTRNNPLYR